MSLSEQHIKKIRESFPEEAIQIYAELKQENGETLTLIGYRPQYIIERLNDCFGHEGWDFTIIKYDIADRFAWVWGRLSVYACRGYSKEKLDENDLLEPIHRTIMTIKEEFGSCKIGNLGIGDALKGAATNALEKCASLLDIGHEAYKGKVSAPKSLLDKKKKVEYVPKTLAEKAPEEIQAQEELEKNVPKLKSMLSELCSQHKMGKTALSAAIKNVLNKEISPAELEDPEDFLKLIKHIKATGAPF